MQELGDHITSTLLEGVSLTSGFANVAATIIGKQAVASTYTYLIVSQELLMQYSCR
jgi:hypothetical protein